MLEAFWHTRPEMAALVRNNNPEEILTLSHEYSDTNTSLLLFTELFDDFGTNEGAMADKLVHASQDIIKAYGKGRPVFRVYDPILGIWVEEADMLQTGESGSSAVNSLMRKLETAAKMSYRYLHRLVVAVFPPLQKPSNADDSIKQMFLIREAIIAEVKKTMRILENLANGIRGKSESIIRNSWKNQVVCDEEDWNSNMRWIVCDDATIDLDLVRHRQDLPIFQCTVPHSPEHMSTNKANASTKYLGVDYMLYDPEDCIPEESAFVTGVARTLPSAEIRAFIQSRFGVALYGDPNSFGKAMVWQYGDSDTAKSSIQEVIAGQNGVFAEYSWSANSSVICSGNTAASDTETNRFKAKAYGKRYVLMNELDDGARLSQSKVKSLTGADTVYGDTKYGSEVNYKFTATLFMASNHGPRMPEGDLGLSSRILVIPFEHHYWIQEKNPEKWESDPENRANPYWVDEVLSSEFERSMILLWTLEGARNYFSAGIGQSIPKAIQEAGNKFKANADTVSQVVDTMFGKNMESDGVNPSYKIYSQEEWDSYGFTPKDATYKTSFLDSFEMTLTEMGLDSDYITKNLGRFKKSALDYALQKYGIELKRIRVGNQRRYVLMNVRAALLSDQDFVNAIEDEKGVQEATKWVPL